MDVQQLLRGIEAICEPSGEIYCSNVSLGNGRTIKAIVIDGEGIKKEGERISAIYSSPEIACQKLLDSFKRVWESSGRPDSMFWRRKPELTKINTDGYCYYVVTVLVAFVPQREKPNQPQTRTVMDGVNDMVNIYRLNTTQWTGL